jgi:energy-coupling factor transporter ATP-binding protein EcfA2
MCLLRLRITHSHNPQQASVNPIFAKAFADNHPILDFLNFNKKHHSDDTLVLGVIGAPGCGKTTLLQHIALIFASQQHRRYKISAYVPLLLFLRQHVQTIMAKELNLADLAYAHFSDTKKYPNLNPPPNWFAEQLDKGKCMILLDGLDEVYCLPPQIAFFRIKIPTNRLAYKIYFVRHKINLFEFSVFLRKTETSNTPLQKRNL